MTRKPAGCRIYICKCFDRGSGQGFNRVIYNKKTMKVLIAMKANVVSEDEDQRGLFNRFFIEEKQNITLSFNKFAEAQGSAMRVLNVNYLGNTESDACARRIATVHLEGDILPTKNSAELHAAFGLDKFFAPQLEYAIALE